MLFVLLKARTYPWNISHPPKVPHLHLVFLTLNTNTLKFWFDRLTTKLIESHGWTPPLTRTPLSRVWKSSRAEAMSADGSPTCCSSVWISSRPSDTTQLMTQMSCFLSMMSWIHACIVCFMNGACDEDNQPFCAPLVLDDYLIMWLFLFEI